MSITLPKHIFSFKMKMLGDETGTEYTGKFTYKRPNIGDRRDISQIEDIFNSEYKTKYDVEILAKDVKNYNYTIAYLKICLIECPEWLKKADYGLTLQDENILDFITFKVHQFEKQRVEKLEKSLSESTFKKEDNETP